MITAKEYKELTKKKSKYRNEITVVDGVKFRSKKESEYYKKLKFLKEKGEITELELQPRFPYLIMYTLKDYGSPVLEKKGAYVSDFRVTWKDGSVEVIDTKGFSTVKFLRDKQIVEKLYGIKIKVV